MATGSALGVRAVQRAWTPGVLGADGREWVGPVGVLAGGVVGGALVHTRRLVPWPGMVTLLIAACLAGAYGCVPETNIIREWAYVIPAFAVGEVIVRRTLPLVAHLAMTGWVLWVALLGAVGRQSAFVGGIFALWPVVLRRSPCGSCRRSCSLRSGGALPSPPSESSLRGACPAPAPCSRRARRPSSPS